MVLILGQTAAPGQTVHGHGLDQPLKLVIPLKLGDKILVVGHLVDLNVGLEAGGFGQQGGGGGSAQGIQVLQQEALGGVGHGPDILMGPVVQHLIPGGQGSEDGVVRPADDGLRGALAGPVEAVRGDASGAGAVAVALHPLNHIVILLGCSPIGAGETHFLIILLPGQEAPVKVMVGQTVGDADLLI